jgi:hypothetical protein
MRLHLHARVMTGEREQERETVAVCNFQSVLALDEILGMGNCCSEREHVHSPKADTGARAREGNEIRLSIKMCIIKFSCTQQQQQAAATAAAKHASI